MSAYNSNFCKFSMRKCGLLRIFSLALLENKVRFYTWLSFSRLAVWIALHLDALFPLRIGIYWRNPSCSDCEFQEKGVKGCNIYEYRMNDTPPCRLGFLRCVLSKKIGAQPIFFYFHLLFPRTFHTQQCLCIESKSNKVQGLCYMSEAGHFYLFFSKISEGRLWDFFRNLGAFSLLKRYQTLGIEST